MSGVTEQATETTLQCCRAPPSLDASRDALIPRMPGAAISQCTVHVRRAGSVYCNSPIFLLALKGVTSVKNTAVCAYPVVDGASGEGNETWDFEW